MQEDIDKHNNNNVKDDVLVDEAEAEQANVVATATGPPHADPALEVDTEPNSEHYSLKGRVTAKFIQCCTWKHLNLRLGC